MKRMCIHMKKVSANAYVDEHRAQRSLHLYLEHVAAAVVAAVADFRFALINFSFSFPGL